MSKQALTSCVVAIVATRRIHAFVDVITFVRRNVINESRQASASERQYHSQNDLILFVCLFFGF